MGRPLIPDRAMATIRSVAARSRRSTCRLLDPPAGRDAEGAPAGGDWTPAGSVPCRVDAASRVPTEGLFGAAIAAEADYVVAFGPDVAVRARQRVAVGGEELEVVGVHDLGTYRAEVYAACTDVD